MCGLGAVDCILAADAAAALSSDLKVMLKTFLPIDHSFYGCSYLKASDADYFRRRRRRRRCCRRRRRRRQNHRR